MIKRRKDSGFTLIELMIVIAVIGILAVVLVPKVGSIKTSAKLTGVTTNYRSVMTALQGGQYTNNASVQTYLNSVFSGNNLLTNPITGSTVISSAQATVGAVISDPAATVPSSTAVANDIGTIVVIPDLTSGTGEIAIYACDDSGKLLTNLSSTLNF
ncbi:MAG: prepilin-type N-terminal cleavage/methylation domain-containing protein [Desulfitobacteriaceae bacterium]